MTTTTLEIAFERLKQRHFPVFSENNKLADWQTDLIELDGHIAGIATTILSGGKPNLASIPQLVCKLRHQLEVIDNIPLGDIRVLVECKNHLAAIDEVVQSMDP